MTFFHLLTEAVLIASCIAAAAGCFALNRRVRRLASTERGIGKAVSEMSQAVDQFEKLLVAAEESTREASAILDEQLVQARKLVARLETRPDAAARAAGIPKTPQRSASVDPLADVAPRGASAPKPAEQPGASGSNRSAERRLAELAQQRATIAGAAAINLGRGARA